MLLLSLDGEVLAATPSAAAEVGLREARELEGRRFVDLAVDADSAADYLRSAARCAETIPGALSLRSESGESRVVRCKARRVVCSRDGEKDQVLLHLVPMETADRKFFVLNQRIKDLAREIAGRKRAEQALRASENKFRTLVESNPEGMIISGRDGRITMANDRAAEIFGYAPSELLGMLVEDLVPKRFAKHAAERDKYGQRPVARPMKSDVTIFGLRKDGSEFPAEISLSPMDVVGGTVFLAVVRDITERKRAEEERRRFEEKVQQAQKLESLGVLAGGIAHDFNNLLLGVIGNADMTLLDLPAEEKVREHVGDILKAAQRAAELCRQLLAYSGKGRFVVESVSLSEVVEEMAHLLEVSIAKKCALRYEFAENLPPVEVDVTQVRQIIMNLITNASDAVGDECGEIIVSTGLDVGEGEGEGDLESDLPGVAFEGPYVYLEVRDNGKGMDEEVISRIFDPFYTTKETGRGLGLAAVQGIVRSHRGRLTVTSKLGEGTAFRIFFPTTDKVATPISDLGTADVGWRGEGAILVVDDEKAVRELAAKFLQHFGFSTLTADNGISGLKLFREHRDEIVAVLLDMTMPVMGGEEAFRALRAMDPAIPVVLSSGYNEHDASLRFSRQGLVEFVQKPYRSSELMKALRSVLTIS